MKTAKEILDSLHPIEKAIVEREFARQKEQMCEVCPHKNLRDSDPFTDIEYEAVLETTDTAFRAEAGPGSGTNAPLRILWVDDDKVIHAIGKKLLAGPELDLHMARGGYEALDLLNKHQYDLMITDLGMPMMTGWQLTAKIKGKYPKMQIAILTGLTYDISRQDMDRHGIRYCLRKPMTKDDAAELLEQVRENR